MLFESVPLRDANEGGCTEISEVPHFKEGIVVWTCLFKQAKQIYT
jgi:hypothetical protein